MSEKIVENNNERKKVAKSPYNLHTDNVISPQIAWNIDTPNPSDAQILKSSQRMVKKSYKFQGYEDSDSITKLGKL